MKKANRVREFIIVSLCVLTVLIVVLQGIQPVKYDVTVGSAAPADIYAGRDVVNTVATERKKAIAESEIEARYSEDTEVTARLKAELADLLAGCSAYRNSSAVAPPDFMDDNQSAKLFMLSDGQINTLKETLTKVHTELLESGVRDMDKSLQKGKEALEAQLSGDSLILANVILENTLGVNVFEDEDATQAARQQARNAVANEVYKKNQIIVRKGDIVNEEQLQVLTDLGVIRASSKTTLKQSAGIIILLIACLVFMAVRVKTHRGISEEEVPAVSIIVAVTMLMTLLGKLDSINIYIIPIIVAGALISVLVDTELGLAANAVIVLLSALVFSGNEIYFATMLISGSLAVFIFSRAGSRRNLVISALILCGVEFVLFTALGFVEGISVADAFIRGVYGIASGLMTAVIIIGTLPFLESMLHITTPFKLLELSNPNNPLLKKLLLEAPGTYHHSLMVGNLAEAACESIGGNSLLARVGAYYHDIGKLKRPGYFTENQYGENPHDMLTPERSAAIITAHTKDGAEMAVQARLPKDVRSIIAAHHGTSIMKYFYHKEKKASGTEPDTDRFSYRGPRPKTKEEAVVMLADSVEAAVRSMDDKNEEAVTEMVKSIISDKLSAGQLEQSDLTFGELDKISNTFIKVLGGYFHNRIKYPGAENEENNK